MRKIINILALGGSGAVGRAAVRELLETTDSKIVIGDTDFDEASSFVSELKDERVTTKFVDGANKRDLVTLLKGFDLLANYTNVRHHHIMLDAAIEAGVNYIDLTGSLHQEKLKLDEKAKKAGITAILAMGAAPGVTSVLAKHAADQLDDVEEIRIYIVRNGPIGTSSGLIDTIMHQFFPEEKGRCYYENGKFVSVPPFSGERVDYFPEVPDPQTTYYWAHAETSMLSRSIKGVKRIEVRGTWPPEVKTVFKTFLDYNFFSKNPIQVKGSFSTNPDDLEGYPVIPRDCLREQLLLNQKRSKEKYLKYYQSKIGKLFSNIYSEVIGVQNGNNTKILYGAIHPKKWAEEAKDVSDLAARGTGIPTAIGTKMLAEGDVKSMGVLTPELAIDSSVFIEKLVERGFKVIERIQRFIG
jgi:saccharopine dehydrogenase-like NADP-dependent oxidoreductase